MAAAPPEEPKIDLGAVVQRGFQTIGRRAAAFFGLAAIMLGLPSFLSQSYVIETISNGDYESFAGPFGAAMLVSGLLASLFQAFVVREAVLALGGRSAEIGKSLGNAFALILPMIGLTVVSSLIIGLGFILLIVPGVIAYIALILAVPVLVEERAGVFGSMERSRALTRGSRGRIFLLLVIYLIVYGVLTGVAELFGRLFVGDILIVAGVQAVVSVVAGVLSAAMLASLYVELRSVREGASADGLAAIFA